MPFPLLPLAASVFGSVLPGMISAIAGAKTPEQARAALAPKFDAAVAELIGRGMRRDEAEKQTEEAMKDEIAAKMQEGALPAWAEALMSIAGGIGGWAAGAKLAGKKLAKAATSEGAEAATKAAPTATAAPEATVVKEVEAELIPPFSQRLSHSPKKGSRPQSGPTRNDEPIEMGQEERGFVMPSSERGLIAPFGGGIDPVTHQAALRRGASRRPMRTEEPQSEPLGIGMTDETVARMRGADTADDRLAAFAEAEAAKLAERDAMRAAAYDELRAVRGAGRPAYHETY